MVKGEAQAILQAPCNGEHALSNATAVRSSPLSEKDIDKIFRTIDIPACPEIVSNVMAETQRDDPNLNWLAKTITADPAMVAIALKLANSSLFRASSPVTDVRRALQRIGMRNIVSVVVATALRTSMAGTSLPFIESFWNQASTLALIAGEVARRQYGVSPDAAFTYALFHDAGIPLMARRFPDYLDAIDASRAAGCLLIDAEDERFPCTHTVVGGLLARNWGMPLMVSQAIRFHHEPGLYDLPDKTLPDGALSLIAVTQIAERIVSENDGREDLEVGDALFARAAAHFGIDEEELDALREAILSAASDD